MYVSQTYILVYEIVTYHVGGAFITAMLKVGG